MGHCWLTINQLTVLALLGLGGVLGWLGAWFHYRRLATVTTPPADPDPSVNQEMAKYRMLFELTRDAVFLIDNDTGEIVEVNPAAVELYGYSREQLLTMRNFDLSAEPAQTRMAMQIKQARIPLRWHRKQDGTVFPVEMVGGHCGWYGRNVHVVAIRDISERHRMESELRQVNQQLQLQLEQIQALQHRLEEQALHDPLTGLYNRRYLQAVMQQELARANRQQSFVSLLILDIDHFKRINDTFGHLAGDYVLQILATEMRSRIRQEDVACRYGGEEFVLLFPGLPPDNAYQRAEDLRRVIKALSIPWENQILQITVSVGIATFPLHGDGENTLLHLADKALYLAKMAGRDRTVPWQCACLKTIAPGVPPTECAQLKDRQDYHWLNHPDRIA